MGPTLLGPVVLLAQPSPLDLPLLLDLGAFAVRPMDRRMNNVRQKELAAIDPQAA